MGSTELQRPGCVDEQCLCREQGASGKRNRRGVCGRDGRLAWQVTWVGARSQGLLVAQ